VTAVVDSNIAEDQVRIRIMLRDGRILDKYVEHAVGSLSHPMTDADLENKFRGLADGILPQAQIRKIMDLCWGIASASDAGNLSRAARSA